MKYVNNREQARKLRAKIAKKEGQATLEERVDKLEAAQNTQPQTNRDEAAKTAGKNAKK